MPCGTAPLGAPWSGVSLHSRAQELATASAGTPRHPRRTARQTGFGSFNGSSGFQSASSSVHSQHTGHSQQEWHAGSRAPSHSRLTRCAAATSGSDTEISSRAWPSSSTSTASRELASRLSAPSAVQHSSDVKHAPAAPSAVETLAAGASTDASSHNGNVAAGPPAPEQPPADAPAAGRRGGRGEQQPDEHGADRCEHPPESGIVPESQLSKALSDARVAQPLHAITTDVTLTSPPRVRGGRNLFLPSEKSQIRDSWRKIMRWSKVVSKGDSTTLEATRKVVVFGGGSFGTAVGAALARQKDDLDVTLLLRDPYVCQDINTLHCNRRYLEDFTLPDNVTATTSMAEAIADAQFAVHAVPVQHSRRFLDSIKDVLPPDVTIISVSKGLEVATGQMMSEIIPSALQRKQPAVFLSGPSFAREVMELCPTVVVAASKDVKLARQVQQLLAGPYMRVNTSTDVTGVEICGALKNVLAIAAGIVQGLELGNNAMAALLSQGCAEIRWLAEKMGAKPATVSGLSGLGDIMLTCYGALSRNRAVGVRLGQGEALEDILASSSQVAEGVSTAAAVVGLGRKHRVSLPVLTAVAQVLDGNLSPKEVVFEIMNLPQIDEK